MGFFIFTRSLRDTTAAKKILELMVNDSQTACFLVDSEGKIILFNDTLTLHVRWSVNALARKPFADLYHHLATQGKDDDTRTPVPDTLFDDFTVFKNFGKRGALLLKGFRIGVFPPPFGLYLLIRHEDLPTEKERKQFLTPMADKLFSRILQPLATFLIDELDLQGLEGAAKRILATLSPIHQHLRVFLADKISLDDSTHFARILYDGPPETPRESLEGVLYGDSLYFHQLSSHAVRPVLVEHTDLAWKYEILLPFTWHLHVFGWLGIPLSSLEVWKEPQRFLWQDTLSELGKEMGEARSQMGLLPHYNGPYEGVMDHLSLLTSLNFMIAQTPPRSFVLLLFRLKEPGITPEFIDLLVKAKRGTDYLAIHPAGIVAVFPDEDGEVREVIENRYKRILERMIVTDFRFQCEMSSYAFPAREWTAEELLSRLVESPGTVLHPAVEIASDDVVFEEWFQRYLLLKDFV